MWDLIRHARTEHTEGWTVKRPGVPAPVAGCVLAFGMREATMTIAFDAPALPAAEQEALMHWLLARLLRSGDDAVSVTLFDGQRPRTLEFQPGEHGLTLR